MTTEDINWLSKFETNFRTAINSNYSRNILESQLRKMVEIYELETGKKYKLCLHCSSQILQFIKDMGKIYFETVQAGNETEVTTNELEKSVTVTEQSVGTNTELNTNESTTTNTNEAVEQQKNNKKKKTMKNAKYTTKQSE